MSSRNYQVVLLPGDGIGVEVMREGRRILDAVAGAIPVSFDLEEIPCGGEYCLDHPGRDWPEGTEIRCEAADVIFLGAVGWPDPNREDGSPVMLGDGKMAGWNPVIETRRRLQLYANVRPVRLYPGVRHKIHGVHRPVWEEGKVDMVFVRENTEGLYSGLGELHRGADGEIETAIDIRRITRTGTDRVIRFAFDLARRREQGAPKDGKKRVTCIAKDNVLKGCQFFVERFHALGKEYPGIERETAIVDAFTQWLLTGPEHYNVCVTTNMFGDIVTDLASVLQGGMGLAVGGNVGDDHAMFEPIHGSAPRHAGKDRANPMAMILAVGEGLRWLGRRKEDADLVRAGDAVEASVVDLLRAGEPLTYDLAGTERAAPTSVVGKAVADRVVTRLRGACAPAS